MPTKKTEYAIAGIRTYVYCSAPDATPRLNSLPVAILFVLHGRNGSYERMEQVIDRLLGVQEPEPEQAKHELIVVAFVGDLCQKLTTAINSPTRITETMESVLSILLGIWRGTLRSWISTTLGMRTFYPILFRIDHIYYVVVELTCMRSKVRPKDTLSFLG
jgi:hypothetical protein